MAHVEKFTKGATSGILKHIERQNEHYSNENIDVSRSELNIDFLKLNGDTRTAKERLDERLSQIKILNRKDVNVMCDWIVTLPEDFLSQDKKFINLIADGKNEFFYYRDFFEETFEFLKSRYGEKNVIAATVHMDEVTPHLHFSFVPVVYDEKKKIEKCSAKEVINRNELKIFHKDLEKHFIEKRKIKLSILNGKTKSLGGNRTVNQLKSENFILETALERNREANKKLIEERKKFEEERKIFEAEAEEVKKYQISEVRRLETEINLLEKEKENKLEEIAQIENDFLTSKEEIDDLKNLPTKQFLNFTTLKSSDFKNLVSEINYYRSNKEIINKSKEETQADREKAQEDRNEAEELLEIAVERLKSANEEEDRVLMKKEWYEEKFEQMESKIEKLEKEVEDKLEFCYHLQDIIEEKNQTIKILSQKAPESLLERVGISRSNEYEYDL